MALARSRPVAVRGRSPLREGDGVPSYGRSRSPRPAHARSTTAGDPIHPVRHLALGSWVKAFAEEYSNIYYLDAARREQVITRWRGESEKYVRFFVALYVPDEKGTTGETRNALEPSRRAGGREGLRARLHPQVVPASGGDLPILPVLGTWYRAYEVAFPAEAVSSRGRAAGSPRLKLVLSGVEGRVVLAWQ